MRVLAEVADGGVEPVEWSRVLPPDERRAGLRSSGQGEGRAEGSLGELHPERRVLLAWTLAILDSAKKNEGLDCKRTEARPGKNGVKGKTWCRHRRRHSSLIYEITLRRGLSPQADSYSNPTGGELDMLYIHDGQVT